MAKKRLHSVSVRDVTELPLTDFKSKELLNSLRGLMFVMKDIIEPHALDREDKNDLAFVEQRIDDLCGELLSRCQLPNDHSKRKEWL